jgi:hypothetical protein
MKKSILIPIFSVFSLLTVWVLAQTIPGTVPVNGPIAPANALDTYSTLHPWYAAGVFKNATNLAGLNSITSLRRVPGMLAYTSSDGHYWALNATATTWVDLGASLAGTDTSIYTHDGSLAGTRIVTINGQDLYFTSAGATGTGSVWFGFDPTAQANGALSNVQFYNVDAFQVKGPAVGNHVNYVELLGKVLNLEASTELRIKTPLVLSSPATPQIGWPLTYQAAGGRVEFTAPSSSLNSGIATLSGGLYTVAAPTPPYTASTVYPDFFAVEVRPNTISAGGESLKWGSGPAKAIRVSTGNPLAVGDLIPNVNYLLTFDTALDAWVLKNSSSGLVFDSATMTSTTVDNVTTIGVNTGAVIPSIAANRFLGRNVGSGTGPGIAIAPDRRWTIKNGVLAKDYDRIMFDVEDFANIGSGGIGQASWTVIASGGGSVQPAVASAGHAGIQQLRCGTSTAGHAVIHHRLDGIEFEAASGNFLYYEALVRITTASSAATHFKSTIGFWDEFVSLDITENDAIAVTYTDSTGGTGNDGKWILEVTTAGVGTPIQSTVPFVVGDWFLIVIEATPTSVAWSINGQPQTAQTANIPTGAARFGYGMKNVGVTGTTDRILQYDRIITYGLYSLNP